MIKAIFRCVECDKEYRSRNWAENHKRKTGHDFEQIDPRLERKSDFNYDLNEIIESLKASKMDLDQSDLIELLTILKKDLWFTSVSLRKTLTMIGAKIKDLSFLECLIDSVKTDEKDERIKLVSERVDKALFVSIKERIDLENEIERLKREVGQV